MQDLYANPAQGLPQPVIAQPMPAGYVQYPAGAAYTQGAVNGQYPVQEEKKALVFVSDSEEDEDEEAVEEEPARKKRKRVVKKNPNIITITTKINNIQSLTPEQTETAREGVRAFTAMFKLWLKHMTGDFPALKKKSQIPKQPEA